MPLRKIVLITLFSSVSGWAHAASFKGLIVDKATQSPVGATVLVEGTPKGTTTDATGHFEQNLPQGLHTRAISYISYVPRKLEVRVPDDLDGAR